VKMMETVLTRAVRAGAEDLAQRMHLVDQSSIVVTGMARARGIALDGYGVFFDVDVPMMRQALVWTQSQMIQQDLRENIAAVNRAIAVARDPQDVQRLQIQRNMLTVQLQSMMPLPLSPNAPTALSRPADAAGATPVANGLAAAAPAASPVSAPAVPPGTVTAATIPGDASSAVSPLPALAADPTDAYNEAYTESVKHSLIDAMLNYSVALQLGDNEWLTVAARDATGPAYAGAVSDTVTIVIRIKGADLTAFHQNRLSRDEVLKKVEIREF